MQYQIILGAWKASLTSWNASRTRQVGGLPEHSGAHGWRDRTHPQPPPTPQRPSEASQARGTRGELRVLSRRNQPGRSDNILHQRSMSSGTHIVTRFAAAARRGCTSQGVPRLVCQHRCDERHEAGSHSCVYRPVGPALHKHRPRLQEAAHREEGAQSREAESLGRSLWLYRGQACCWWFPQRTSILGAMAQNLDWDANASSGIEPLCK